MDQNDTRIEELQSRIKESQSELKEIFREAGERIASEKLYNGDDETINKLLKSLEEQDEQLKSIDGRMDDLRTSYNRISEIAEREKEIGEEYALLEKENKKIFPTLGKAAFLILKGGKGGESGKPYESLIEAEKKLHEFDNEIFRLESSGGKKKFFEALKEKSRLALIRSKKKRLEISMEGLYGKLCEKIYRKDPSFLESLEDVSADAFRDNRGRMVKLDSEIDRLKEENSNLEKYLKTEFNSNRQKKTEEKMQSQRDMALSRKMAGVYELGVHFYREKISLGNEEVGELLASAAKVYSSIDIQEQEIEKLKAELEIVKLEEEVSDMKKNIKELEITIEKCNGDISEFNSEIKRARAEIRKLKKLTDSDPASKEI